jgi:hypothetical protein
MTIRLLLLIVVVLALAPAFAGPKQDLGAKQGGPSQIISSVRHGFPSVPGP